MNNISDTASDDFLVSGRSIINDYMNIYNKSFFIASMGKSLFSLPAALQICFSGIII